MNKGKVIVAALVVFLVQAGVVGAMVVDRLMVLSSGQEITLKTVPVDPRDLFRGDYVILRYDISDVTLADVESPEGLKRHDEVYAVLTRDDDWRVVRIARTLPEAVADGSVVLRGRIVRTTNDDRRRTVRIAYGLESYFVPEGTGRDLEDMVRERALSVIVAVTDDGESQIKGLVIDGERIYDEPLF